MRYDLNNATFVGVDAHREEHTAVAMNRFEDETGMLTFANTHEGINSFLVWLKTIGLQKHVIIGVEGGGTTRRRLLSSLVYHYVHVYEVNPLYTKQRRDYGTRGDKSDKIDAKLIAEVLTRKLDELPRITKQELSPIAISLRKAVWFHEERATQGARIQCQVKHLQKERSLARSTEEKSILACILREKKSELARIRKTQRKLLARLNTSLATRERNLKTVPGIDTVLAAKLSVHTNGIERFKTIWGFLRYAGVAPSERSSGKTRRHIKGTKYNRKLNATLYMVTLNQLRWNKKAKEYFEKKITEGKTRRHAMRCLMKRVACIVYGMMRTGKDYRN